MLLTSIIDWLYYSDCSLFITQFFWYHVTLWHCQNCWIKLNLSTNIQSQFIFFFLLLQYEINMKLLIKFETQQSANSIDDFIFRIWHWIKKCRLLIRKWDQFNVMNRTWSNIDAISSNKTWSLIIDALSRAVYLCFTFGNPCHISNHSQ